MIICLFCLNYDIVGIISFGKIVIVFVEKWNFFLLEKGLCIDLVFFILNLKKKNGFCFNIMM